ncbi:MAG: glycosyltransferase [Caldithrix sp.]|nr:glycosyltransferase [Caldithrix sp.]
MASQNLITVVIPHYNGKDILNDCLSSLYKNTFPFFETLLIDNGSTDGSQKFIDQQYPQVKCIQNKINLGYAGACNQGIQLAKTPFILLLNNDTVMPANFLEQMYQSITSNRLNAAVQPKILSIQDKRHFDYSGGAGGEMDQFGYPFARGRIFDLVEKDDGQYDDLTNDVFWTSGCALLMRKSVAEEIGTLDEDFFAHQEEIDWNWRARLAGYNNKVTTVTHILHYSGYTLRSDNQYKMYLNHRNNIIMMIKNYSLLRLIYLLPIRILMEFTTVVVDALFWEGKRARAVLKALWYIVAHSYQILKKHKQVQQLRRKPDKQIMKNMYKRSIVFQHFVKKRSPFECVGQFRNSV